MAGAAAMSGGEEALAHFVAVTGAEPRTARGLLEACGGDLERAVNLFFSGPDAQAAPALTDEQLARQLAAPQQSSAGPSGGGLLGGGDEEVRAPIPARVDRLYGDDFLMHARSHMGRPPPPRQEVNAFRDFEAEGSRAPGSGGGGGGGSRLEAGLGALFEPPTGLLFEGGLEEGKAEAQRRNVWLLVNLQSNIEFASHQLNRDTWSDPMLQDVLRGSFLFLQAQAEAPEGARLQAAYRLAALPAIVVVDPLTGSAMRTFTGFQPADRLMEEIVPFMDHPPDDPAAQRLGAAHLKRKLSHARAPPAGPPPLAMSEEEELALALRMSATQAEEPPRERPGEPAAAPPAPAAAAAAAPDPGGAAGAGPGAAAPPAAPGKTPEQVQQEAAAALPPETDAAGAAGCRLALRLPGGARVTRLLPRAAPLRVLRTLVLASSAEAAGGRPFTLKEAQPGAAELADWEQTVEAAGLANAMLNVAWST